MGKDNSKICSQEEFERFKYFNEWFNRLIEGGKLPSEHFDKLYEGICDFETAIVQIAQKVGVDLSEHVDTVGEIWEQSGAWPTPCIPPCGDEYGEVASNACYECEEKTKAWKEAIHDLNKVMLILHENFEQQPEKKHGKGELNSEVKNRLAGNPSLTSVELVEQIGNTSASAVRQTKDWRSRKNIPTK